MLENFFNNVSLISKIIYGKIYLCCLIAKVLKYCTYVNARSFKYHKDEI